MKYVVSLPVIGLLVLGCLSAQAQTPVGQRVSFPGFSVDQTEVTIGQFAGYADAHKVKTQAERQGYGNEYSMGWQERKGWNFRAPYGKQAAPDEPAVHVTWYEARDYCKAQGGFLPTREQWASAAYLEQRANPPSPFQRGKRYPYPTGDTPDGANVDGKEDGWNRHAPAGRTKAGVNGLYDMGANVWEWLADGDNKDEAKSENRLTAGGSWWYGPDKMREEGMQFKPAAFSAVYVGFRCAYAP